ncbi:MAG TPA: hypothetical protein P5085_02560 [Paludibacteraceae bacterium]|nr:hypothetical protein [Paludibacteraceae bacterium]HRT78113.1 hypothetical protein [Paludibacteraceae bacterium]
MARKLYVFGIGGTGSRVIKSLAMLLAAGVKLENEFDTVVPILIDPDTENGDLNRTKDILRLYQEIRNQIKDPDGFFKQDLRTVNELANPQSHTISPDYFQFKLNDVDSTTFGQYIGFDSLSDDYRNFKDDKSFVKTLYSNSNLNSNLSIGFKGNPNMGSIVLNQFTNSEDFKRFGQTFGPEDAIFIINSIFGGTGAAGFPLLLKNLRGNPNLLNFSQIKDAPIGGLTYLPYFTLDKKEEINAESFEEKAKIAIDYYNRTIINQRKINVLHFIGNRGNTNAEEYAVGGPEQKNKAHFLEVAGALAIIEFCKNIGNYSCNNGTTTRPTEIKEFGIERANENISFDDLNIDNKEQLYKPLTKFRLFTQYLNEGLLKAKNVSRWTKSNFFILQKQKKSPCNPAYFESAEYKNQIVAFNNHFKVWIDELSRNKPAFNPFFDIIPNDLYTKIDTINCLNIDNLQLRSEIDTTTGKPKQIHTTLIKLFGISTDKVYQKLPVRVNNQAKKVIKVFRLHQGQEGTGWFKSAAIDKDALKTIKTEGRDIASSIPSPFARIDLVKSAFDWINYQISSIVGAYPQGVAISREDKIKIREIIEGRTAQNKLISDALDVAQMFYEYPNISDKIEIIAWNPRERFNDLIENSLNNRHKIFAETLKIYWEQDSVTQENQDNVILYNFEHVKRLYFIINKNTNQVIGGTSPATLFFAAPDAKSAINGLEIRCGQDILLDDIYFLPLHKREVSFIEYMYAFAKQSNNFSFRFPEVYTYLKNIEDYLLDDNMRTVVANLSHTSIDNYERCHISFDDQDYCEILNLKLGTKTSFLENKIIELPYSIDSSKFKTCGSKKHLLPVTQAFIKRYGIKNIEQYCRVEERAGGGVEVILNVPVQNRTLPYRKLYQSNDIIKLKVHLAILPFLKAVRSHIDYTIAIIDDRSDKSENISLSCLNNGQELQASSYLVVRNPGINDVKSIYYKFNSPFDSVCFKIGSIESIIIPRLTSCTENDDNVAFAIDFGTTNTHIEYSFGRRASVPFDNVGTLPLWQSLMDRKDRNIDPVVSANEETFENEMMPYLISTPGSIIKFPLRTAIVFNRDYSFSRNNPYQLFQHVNNYLLYEKRTVPRYYLTPDTQLKWSNHNDYTAELKVNAYIEYLLTIVYYKALLLGANPSNTKIVWFYPVSMEGAENSDGELGIFIRLWKAAYQKVFSMDNTNNLLQVPESVAPYLYYKPQVAGLSLSIDIGGGSSDIAVFDEHSPNAILISSFKFAGNAIFGDGYPTQGERGNADNNGWVKTFLEEAESIAGEEYEGILEDILSRKDSADFSNFLFSLENDRTINFSYSRLIEKDKKLKLTILVFYGALAYYSANLLKKSGIEDIPKYILLSGTAAKTANILDSSPSDNLINLSLLFKYIFEHVYDKKMDRNIILKVAPNPKEITCKGALESGINESITQNTIKFWLGGINGGIWGKALDKETNVTDTPKYEDIDDKAKRNICASIKEFYKILDDYTETVRFETKFLIEQNAYEKFREIREMDIEAFLERGLEAFHKTKNHHIEETLFFYPLIGILNKLTYELSQI